VVPNARPFDLEVGATGVLGAGVIVAGAGFEVGACDAPRPPPPGAAGAGTAAGFVAAWAARVIRGARRECEGGAGAWWDGRDSRFGRLGSEPKPPSTPRVRATTQAASSATPVAITARSAR
jgi:hypothetical protein